MVHGKPREVAYLREKAARFRDLAAAIKLPVAVELLDLAEEMEACAREIERGRDG
jgi:hypothetical protein